jgi:hypothetical protein
MEIKDIIVFLEGLKDLRIDNGKLNYEEGELPFGTVDYYHIDDMIEYLKGCVKTRQGEQDGK